MSEQSLQKGSPMTKVLVGLLVIVALAIGGGAWWIMRIGHEEKAVAKSFLTALQNGDAKGAQSYCTPDVDGNVEFFAKHLPEWGPVPSYDDLVAMTRPNRTDVSGRLEWGTQTVKTFDATIVKQGNVYKIKAFHFQ